MSNTKKLISLLLVICFSVSSMQIPVFAKDNKSNSGNAENSTNTSVVKNQKSKKITKELTNERTENSKKFQKEDGSFEVDQYNSAIHYQDGSQWKDIDNTLEESKDKDDDGNNVLENKQNNIKVKISKNSSSKKLVQMKKDKYEINWSLSNVQSSKASVVTADENKINDDIDKSVENEVNNDKELTKVTSDEKQQIKEALKTNEKIKDLKNITSQVNFQNVYDNTDLQYILNGSDIKENLIINKYNDNTSFSFNINTKNVTPVLQQDKSIIFFDSKDKSKKVFQIEAPYMYDKVDNSSDKIEVAINQSKDGYLLTLTPDKTWLSSSDRVYPVTIDPSMQTSLDSSKIHDTFVASIDTENKCNNQYVRVGLTPGNVGTCRTYIKFDLPTLSTGDMITNAQLNLLQCSDVSSVASNQVNVHNVTQNFDTSKVTWSTQPSYDSHIEALNMITSNQNQWVNWDVTSIVKQWFTTGNNYGIMLEQDNSSKYTAFWSSDIHDAFTSARPMISFNYINNSGIESYWTYHSQNVGRAGTSYINDYNGNLVFTHNDIDMSGSRMPVSINHVFNSNDSTTPNIGFGSGWRLNINQRLESQTINNTQYYKYTDEDGTKHYFQNSGSMPINDELNLELSLTKEGDGSLSISDKKNNKINFSSSTNDLNYIKDANGNTITFTYGGTSSSGVRNITKVTD